MKKQTKAERIAEYLIKTKGAAEVTSRSRKYRTFTRPDIPGTFFFVGKAGALRTGKNVSDSYSLNFDAIVHAEGSTR
jgi:hypothetical protein